MLTRMLQGANSRANVRPNERKPAFVVPYTSVGDTSAPETDELRMIDPPPSINSIAYFITMYAPSLMPPLNQIRATLGYSNDGSVGISADDIWHDRCVDHSEPVYPEDTKLRVDHPTYRSRARRMVEGLRMAFDEGPNVRVPAGRRHEMRPPAHRCESGPLNNVHCELHVADHAPPIFFSREVVRENPRLNIRPRYGA